MTSRMYVHLTVGEQYICAGIRVYTYNHGRAATLIRDNRVGVYGRVDSSRGVCTSVTHTRPDEFRVVPVSGEMNGEGPGSTLASADGNEGARMDSDQIRTPYISYGRDGRTRSRFPGTKGTDECVDVHAFP